MINGINTWIVVEKCLTHEILLFLTPMDIFHDLCHVTKDSLDAIYFTHTIKALQPFFKDSSFQFVLGFIHIFHWLELQRPLVYAWILMNNLKDIWDNLYQTI